MFLLPLGVSTRTSIRFGLRAAELLLIDALFVRVEPPKLPRWRKRLDAIDPKSWPIEQQNDYKLVKAEMNGLDSHYEAP